MFLTKLAEVIIPIAAFFGGIGMTLGVVRNQVSSLSKACEDNKKDIKELRDIYNEDVRKISVQLGRIEAHLGINE